MFTRRLIDRTDKRRQMMMLILVCVSLLALIPQPAAAQTRHTFCDRFEIYWAEHGGLARFGYRSSNAAVLPQLLNVGQSFTPTADTAQVLIGFFTALYQGTMARPPLPMVVAMINCGHGIPIGMATIPSHSGSAGVLPMAWRACLPAESWIHN